MTLQSPQFHLRFNMTYVHLKRRLSVFFRETQKKLDEVRRSLFRNIRRVSKLSRRVQVTWNAVEMQKHS